MVEYLNYFWNIPENYPHVTLVELNIPFLLGINI